VIQKVKIRNCLKCGQIRGFIAQLLHFYHECDDKNMTRGKDRGGKAIGDHVDP